MNKLIFYLIFFLASYQGQASDDFQKFLSLLEAEERAPSPLLEGNNLTPEEDVFLTEEEVSQFSTQPSQSEGSVPSIYPFGTSGIYHPLQFYTTPLSFSAPPPLISSPPFSKYALPSYEVLAWFFRQSLQHPFPPFASNVFGEALLLPSFCLKTSLSVETPKKRKIREEEDHSFLEIVKRRRITAPSPFLSEEETALQKKQQIKKEEFEKRIPYQLTEDQKKPFKKYGQM